VLRSVIAYGIAVAALLAAVAARWLLDPILGDSVPFITLFGAVAVAVWIGGVGPALVVAVLGYLACGYLFMEPRYAMALDDRNLVALLAFLVTCSFIIGFCEAMRRARRRAEIEEVTLRVTFASMGDAVLCTDREARITSLNPVAEFLTGWPSSDAVGQPLDAVFRIVNEQTRQAVENPAARALREGVVVGLANQTLLVKRDGTECPIDDRAAPIRDAHGQIVGCVLTFRDITERRRIERRLTERLAGSYFLASIIKSSQDAIISKTLDGTILSWNAAAERMFGHTAAEAIGRHISLLIPPDRISEEEQIIAQLRAGRRVEHFDTVRLRNDGERIHVSLTISPIEDEAGHVIGASKIVRDVSDRIRTDAELRSRNERLRLLSDAADILLSTQDADTMLRQLLDRIGPYLALDAYLHYLADESGGSLRLASCDGVPQEAVPALGRLEIGQSVCGAVALRKQPIHATRIQQSDESMVQQIKSFGIRVYACYPLMSDQRLLGTLSFASRTRRVRPG
jgi:PAS domain S-box-containing protein